MEKIEVREPLTPSRLYLTVKRLMDVVVSFLLLCILSPLICIISYRIAKKEGRPILSREALAGKDNQSFIRYSFRVMTNPSRVIRFLPQQPYLDSWREGVPNRFDFQNDDHCTVTSTGLWLIKYNLHKLPRLYSVLKGDMSLIGPKPEYMEIANTYNQKQKESLQLRPGLIGYTRVFFGNELTYSERAPHDLYYIQHCSFALDIKIISKFIFCRLK
ncbi:sugar transferase [Oceanobacillus piezotolerans]|uniref:Sugar transferase n=1 Tax=Oceanobacillus piezotolerans TaxID=2448030 RepID=A0A498D162_9BACI|nr:sugar transferase [Oceanobacillus piezotolerans]RLL40334.1 sugar transferase [Oceanobacillus piezotolerans]